MSQPTRKLLWAVDAFSDDAALNKKLSSFLKKWTKNSPTQVEPVYVLSPDQLSVPLEIFAEERPQNESEARERLAKIAKKSNIPGSLAPSLLVSNTYSLRSAVQAIVDYAGQTKADLIAVGTQSKKGVTRFLFGSFAESLVLYSDIPVLMLTPETQPNPTLKRVIFATDFSDPSRAAYSKVLDLAESLKLSITLYNKVEYVSQYTFDLISKNPGYERYFEAELLRRGQLISEMAEQARARGLEAVTIVDSRPNSLSIPDSIFKAVKSSQSDLIAIASQSGPVAVAVLGSVARQIIRRAKIPVWIIHPTRPAQSQLKPQAVAKKGAA